MPRDIQGLVWDSVIQDLECVLCDAADRCDAVCAVHAAMQEGRDMTYSSVQECASMPMAMQTYMVDGVTGEAYVEFGIESNYDVVRNMVVRCNVPGFVQDVSVLAYRGAIPMPLECTLVWCGLLKPESGKVRVWLSPDFVSLREDAVIELRYEAWVVSRAVRSMIYAAEHLDMGSHVYTNGLISLVRNKWF